MADIKPISGNGNLPAHVAKIEILYDQMTGQITVNGPLQAPALCYGILEMAKFQIDAWVKAQAAGKRIEVPSFAGMRQ